MTRPLHGPLSLGERLPEVAGQGDGASRLGLAEKVGTAAIEARAAGPSSSERRGR